MYFCFGRGILHGWRKIRHVVAHLKVFDDDGMTHVDLQVLSGLSGVSAYPFGHLLQDAGCILRREEECKTWKTADESLARKLSGEGGLQVRSESPELVESYCLCNWHGPEACTACSEVMFFGLLGWWSRAGG